MKKIISIIGFSLGLCGLITLRFFEEKLFYDPLLDFYHGDFLEMPFPKLDFWLYSFNLGFRYFLNTFSSLILIWFAFENKTYIKFSLILFIALFLLGSLVFWIIENNITSESYMQLFYVRRFLIQPLLVIVLLPAFYFQQLNNKA